MKDRSMAMAWIIGGSILGLALSHGEVAQAGIRTCLGAPSIAGIDFSDCKALAFGAPPPDVELFKLSMARQLTVVIAQYNTDFTATYAQRTVNGLIAVQYESRQARIASSITRIQCLIANSSARQLGCDTNSKLLEPRIAFR